ncbi:hypothetical protein HYS93_02290 [Candidatus Daviesbacteria bacterium]|nr:hypothetical protein [Candidatus Daviesbacteria bacterium]
MNQININLLPIDLTLAKREEAKKSLVLQISIGLLVFTVAVAAIVLFLSLSDNFSIRNTESQISQIKEKIATYKRHEGLTFVLKDRLDGIKSLTSAGILQSQSFNLVTELMPKDMILISFNNSKKDIISLTGETTSTKSLQTFFNKLTNPSEHQGKIVSTKVENLNRSPTSVIRFELTVVLSKASFTQ